MNATKIGLALMGGVAAISMALAAIWFQGNEFGRGFAIGFLAGAGAVIGVMVWVYRRGQEARR